MWVSLYVRFTWQVNDHHLGTILNPAFQESEGLESDFKVKHLIYFVS